jgi:hypothetical protein
MADTVAKIFTIALLVNIRASSLVNIVAGIACHCCLNAASLRFVYNLINLLKFWFNLPNCHSPRDVGSITMVKRAKVNYNQFAILNLFVRSYPVSPG